MQSTDDYFQELYRSTRLVAQHFGGAPGQFSYAAFDHINATYFQSRLPLPLMLWGIIPHGFGITYNTGLEAGTPIILLHYTLLGERETKNPWGIPSRCLGKLLVYEALINQCIQLAVAFLHERPYQHRDGTYHPYPDRSGAHLTNSPAFAQEVNRLAPLLGFKDVNAGPYVMRRVATGEQKERPLKDGRTKVTTLTKPTWVQEGNLSARDIQGFPVSLRLIRDAAYYTRTSLPFEFISGVALEQTE